MRFGRLILLAGLAPLIGLPAFVAILSAAASSPANAKEQAQVALVSPSADFASIVISPERSLRQAVLALTVLAFTPLRHSVWMMEGPAATLLPNRVPLHPQLRC